MGSIFYAPTINSKRCLLQGTNNVYCTVLHLQQTKQERQQAAHRMSMDARKGMPLHSYQISFLHVLHIVWNLSVEVFLCPLNYLYNPSMICIHIFYTSFQMWKITDVLYMMKSLRQGTAPVGKCWESTLIWP